MFKFTVIKRSKLWESSKQINYLKNGKVQFQKYCFNFFYFSQKILNYFRVIEEMNLLNSDVYKQATQISKKYTTLFGKYGACHILFNAKLIYSPIMLQELSKFYYRTISEKMRVLRIWNFQEWFEMEQKLMGWSR